MKITDEAIQAIKTVDMRSVAELYGVSVNSRGFALCPFHGEKTPSMRVYDGDRGYHCFGCEAGGDVIDFVKKLFGLDFEAACKKINDDFGLGAIRDDISPRQKLSAAAKAFEMRKEREKAAQAKEKAKDEYFMTLEAFVECERKIAALKPSSADDVSEAFLEALADRDRLKYELSAAETAWMEVLK